MTHSLKLWDKLIKDYSQCRLIEMTEPPLKTPAIEKSILQCLGYNWCTYQQPSLELLFYPILKQYSVLT